MIQKQDSDVSYAESELCITLKDIPSGNGTNGKSEIADFDKHVNGLLREPVFELPEASNSAADRLPAGRYRSLICYHKINNIRYLNKYFEAINNSLETEGLFVGCVEINYQYRKRIREKYPRVVVYPFLFVHFLIKRVLPKWAVSKRLYFYVTRGKGRVISLTEVLGRLISCGFEISSYRFINGQVWYTAIKKQAPLIDKNPTYGALVGLNRVGKNGKMLRIYKFRTMHPFSEYLQDFVFDRNNLKEGGKINEDMRVTGWGRFLRKWWLDEQPMWWNFLKREIKLVGVRPLSRHYFSLYPEEMQTLRIRHKPGLIPPFYYDMPSTFEEIVDSERRYLLAYEKHPFRTDVRYLLKALYNIFVKRARSG